jgi:hypothetical protein
MSSMDKLRHVYHHGWADTDTYRSVDSFLVNRLGRPTREERYQHRAEAFDEGVKAALFGASFMVGTGRVRAGRAAVGVGTKAVSQVGRSLSGFMFARTRGKLALASVPTLINAARGINAGLRTKRQGRILQAAGLGGLLWNRFR